MAFAQVVGIAASLVLLKTYTPLPFWTCVVLSVPLFLFLFWTVIRLLSKSVSVSPQHQEVRGNTSQGIMNFESVTDAVEFYCSGVITLRELLGEIYGLAASGSIEDLLSALPPDLEKELSHSCVKSPAGRENWMLVESVCRREGTGAEEAEHHRQRREREDLSYLGYCRLHEHFHVAGQH